MVKNKNSITKFILTLFSISLTFLFNGLNVYSQEYTLIIRNNYAFINDEDEKNFIETNTTLKRGEIDEAKKKIFTIGRPNESALWAFMLGLTYNEAKEYDEALFALSVAIFKFEYFYGLLKIEPKIMKMKDFDTLEGGVKGLLFSSLLSSAMINWNQKNWDSSARDYIKIIENPNFDLGNKIVEFNERISTTYYMSKKFELAIKYAKDAYDKAPEFKVEQKLLNKLSYNISAYYALLRKEENAIKWAKKSLDNNPTKYYKLIKKDSDFKSLNKSEKFIKFVESYKN